MIKSYHISGWNSSRFDNKIEIYRTFLFEGLEFHCHDESELKTANEIINYLQLMKIRYKIPPTEYENVIGQWLKNCTGISMNWKNPRTIQEKIQWLKLYDSTPLKTLCADKFRSKDYVVRKIGAEYVIPLLGVWNDPDEINLDTLPNQFVLKCNHGCGMNIIVRDKSKFDLESAKEKLKAWLAVDYGMFAFEFHYSKIFPKVLAEEFIHELDSDEIPNYKFYCFNGEPQFIQFENESNSRHLTMLNLDWKLMPFQRSDHETHSTLPSKPKKFELMKKLALKLSEDFSFVRVDFYELGNQILFGELTFTPTGGIFMYSPSEWNLKVGVMLNLLQKQKPFNPFK